MMIDVTPPCTTRTAFTASLLDVFFFFAGRYVTQAIRTLGGQKPQGNNINAVP
jgi:hypothetical protein